MKKVNIIEKLKSDRELHMHDKIIETHARIYRLINELNIHKYKPKWEDIKEYDSKEELEAYCDMYNYGSAPSHPVLDKKYEKKLLKEIEKEKKNLKTLYLIKNRPESGMLKAQTIGENKDLEELMEKTKIYEIN